jgi:hypothetical protein
MERGIKGSNFSGGCGTLRDCHGRWTRGLQNRLGLGKVKGHLSDASRVPYLCSCGGGGELGPELARRRLVAA